MTSVLNYQFRVCKNFAIKCLSFKVNLMRFFYIGGVKHILYIAKWTWKSKFCNLCQIVTPQFQKYKKFAFKPGHFLTKFALFSYILRWHSTTKVMLICINSFYLSEVLSNLTCSDLFHGRLRRRWKKTKYVHFVMLLSYVSIYL